MEDKALLDKAVREGQVEKLTNTLCDKLQRALPVFHGQPNMNLLTNVHRIKGLWFDIFGPFKKAQKLVGCN